MFDLILFDLDGTLIDSASEIAAATNAVLASRGLDTVALATVRDWIGNGARETVIHALANATGRSLEALRAAQDEIDEAMECFAAAYNVADDPAEYIFSGVIDTLEALQADGVLMALVTNKERVLTERVLPLCGFDRFFDPVIAGDTLPRRKPDPLPVQHCLARHNLAPERALLVGDSPVDVETARAAGIHCWAVSWGYSCGRPIAEWQPDRVLSSFPQLLDVLEGAPAGSGVAAAQ